MVGGGQLARMTSQAATGLGIGFRVLAEVATDMVLAPEVLVFTLVGALLVGAAGALPTAVQASRRSVVDGLRRAD